MIDITSLRAEKSLQKRIIAACGNDCSACPRYVAHPFEKTEEELHHTADLWMRIGYRDRVVTIHEISCSGCKPENWCRYRVVSCCEERGVKTCAECAEYLCENIKECFEVTRSFEPKCREACTEDEYERLKKAFLEKEKNLSEIRGDFLGDGGYSEDVKSLLSNRRKRRLKLSAGRQLKRNSKECIRDRIIRSTMEH